MMNYLLIEVCNAHYEAVYITDATTYINQSQLCVQIISVANNNILLRIYPLLQCPPPVFLVLPQCPLPLFQFIPRYVG